MRAAGLICLVAGAGLIRADLRAVHGTDVTCRSGGVVVPCAAPGRATVPVLARYHDRLLAAAAFRRDRADLRRDRPRPPEHHHAADRRAGRRGGLPRLDTSRLRATWLADARGPARAGHVHARRRDHLLPAPRRPARQPGTRRRGRRGPAARGGPAAMIRLPALEEITDPSGIAPRIEPCCPPACAPASCPSAPCCSGMCLTAGRPPARPPHPRPPGTGHPARGRPAAARRDRGLEGRPAPADIPPDRADLRPRHRRARQGHPRRAAFRPRCSASATTCSRPSIPEEFKDASTALAVDWTDAETFSRPPTRGTSDCADPEASWGHRTPAAAPAKTASCSSATTSPPPP